VRQMPPDHDCYDKPIWTLRRLLEVLPSLPAQLARVLPTVWGARLSNAERERVMLAVATANRCRYCQVAHGGLGRAAGLSADEVSSLLRGDDAPPLGERDRLALRYVRDRAAREFRSADPALRDEVQARLGREGLETIDATAQVMNFVNRFGNSFDALLTRLAGRCEATGASWLDLAVVSTAFVLALLAVAGPVALGMAAGRLRRQSGSRVR
jgi:AhpD family alkylhydroperoxidase